MALPWQGFETQIIRAADAQLGVDIVDGKVGVWRDNGPRANNTQQTDAALRPPMVELDGLPAMRFDGTQRLINPNGVTGVVAGDRLTGFVVARFDPSLTDVFDSGLFELGTTLATRATGLSIQHEGTDLYATMAAERDANSRWPNDGKTHIFEIVHATEGRALIVDGDVRGIDQVTQATPAGIDSLIEGAIGANALPFQGWMQSHLIFNGLLSLEDRGTIRQRLRIRWPGNPPEIQNWDPAPGSIIAPEQPISFDVIGDSPIVQVVVLVRYRSGHYEVAWDGAKFADNFRARSSRGVVLPRENRFQIRRFGLWLGNPTVEVRAVDELGRTLSASNSALAPIDSTNPAPPLQVPPVLL